MATALHAKLLVNVGISSDNSSALHSGKKSSPTLAALRSSAGPRRLSLGRKEEKEALSGKDGRKNVLSSTMHGSQLPALKLKRKSIVASGHLTVECSSKKNGRPLRVMISGAPASGKGTQCEQIVQHYGLTHISAGDLLRAEVAAGTENGKKAKAYMDAGKLVPDEVVVTMVRARLAQEDAQTNGWLLDGYPRSASQAQALVSSGIHPDIFIVLEVPDRVLVDRVIGRRQDPVTGKIYHLKFSPPETQEIADRLTQRSDDTEDKVKARLDTHKSNVKSVCSTYKDVMATVDGNRPKDKVFQDVDMLLRDLHKARSLVGASR